jgi:hypothetical protein
MDQGKAMSSPAAEKVTPAPNVPSDLIDLLVRFTDCFGVGLHPSMSWKRTRLDDGIEMVHHDGDTIFFGDPNHQDPPDQERFDLIVALANAVPSLRAALSAAKGET